MPDDFIPPKNPRAYSSQAIDWVRRTVFGDLYAVRSEVGMLNTEAERVTLEWDWVLDADAEAIATALRGWKSTSFVYTLPRTSTPKKWTYVGGSLELDKVARRPNTMRVRAQIQQEFDP